MAFKPPHGKVCMLRDDGFPVSTRTHPFLVLPSLRACTLSLTQVQLGQSCKQLLGSSGTVVEGLVTFPSLL